MGKEMPEVSEPDFLENMGTKYYQSLEELDDSIKRLEGEVKQRGEILLEKRNADISGEIFMGIADSYARVVAELDEAKRLKHGKPWSELKK